MNKKAFTLTELAIVIFIMGIIIGGFINVGKTALEKQKIEDTKNTMEHIKQNMISYLAVRGNLPSTNGGTELEPLEDQIFGAKSVDNFGMQYHYDVGSQFVSSDDHNICRILTDVNHTANYPQMADDTNVSKYSVVAVIVSSGKNKTFDGINSDNDRIYSMKGNRYTVDKDDIVEELTYFEVIESVCTFADFNHTR